jgi:iron only hydrogenase large subunit-like protein
VIVAMGMFEDVSQASRYVWVSGCVGVCVGGGGVAKAQLHVAVGLKSKLELRYNSVIHAEVPHSPVVLC